MLLKPTPRNPSFSPFLPSSSDWNSKFKLTVEPASEIHSLVQSSELAEVVLSTYRWVRSSEIEDTSPSVLKKTL